MSNIIRFPARPGMIAHSTDKFIVVPHEGRFVVAKRAAGSLSEYHVVDDCRTKAFADARAEALNEGKVVI